MYLVSNHRVSQGISQTKRRDWQTSGATHCHRGVALWEAFVKEPAAYVQPEPAPWTKDRSDRSFFLCFLRFQWHLALYDEVCTCLYLTRNEVWWRLSMASSMQSDPLRGYRSVEQVDFQRHLRFLQPFNFGKHHIFLGNVLVGFD